MLRRFVLWLLRWLQESLDPELKARLEQYRKDRTQLEATTTSVLAEIAQREIRLSQVQTQRSLLEQTIASYEAQLQTLKQEVIQIDSEKHSPSVRLSDGDALRARL